ncbi:MAG: hypothetical protein IMY72_08970 [Bacteroidetes bacterium]|nr:hypothetical protein [Bacteroidota bacterium]
MPEIIEILKYILPSLIVFLTAYLLINKFINNDQHKRKLEIILNNQKIITPIKLQAYERLILFLERISTESLIIRTQQTGMTSKQLHISLLSTIRAEFEHNISQQLYVTPQAWELVKASKENTIKLINYSAANTNPKLPSLVLSRTIIEKVMEKTKAPSTEAIDFLKKEMSSLF